MMTNDTEESVPKLIDFGLAKMFYIGETSDDRYGTLAFCSPEVILGRAHNVGTDVWSLGIVLHYLISGTIPFLSRDKNDEKKTLYGRGYPFRGHSGTESPIMPRI